MKNSFLQIKRHLKPLRLEWVSRSFATGSTFRMLRIKSPERIREFLSGGIVHKARILRARSEIEYDKEWKRYVHLLRKGFRNIPFGHAAKLVNLFIKELTYKRDVLPDKTARRIQQWAHVPLDRIILKRVYKDFPHCSVCLGLSAQTTIKDLTSDQYWGVQDLLRKEAKRARMKPLDYDLWWAVRTPRSARQTRGRRKA